MSAAPAPKPEPTPQEAADAEGWALLDGLRRRMDDHSAQNRKTQAQIHQLAESIAALVGDQRRRARWLNINSFAAYLVFTVLLGGAFYFLYQSRVRELVRRADSAVRPADGDVRKPDEPGKAAREAAAAKAYQAWQLFDAGKRDEAQKLVGELATAPLSKLEQEALAARARQPEGSQAEAAQKAALAAFKAGKFTEVAPPCEAALAKEPSGPGAAELHYLAGMGRAKTGDVDAAIAHLTAAVNADVTDDDARFQLASVEDRAGQWAKARADYDKFATAHPQSPFAALATRRSATLAKMGGAAGAPAPGGAAPASGLGPRASGAGSAGVAPAQGASGAAGAKAPAPKSDAPASEAEVRSPKPEAPVAAPAAQPPGTPQP